MMQKTLIFLLIILCVSISVSCAKIENEFKFSETYREQLLQDKNYEIKFDNSDEQTAFSFKQIDNKTEPTVSEFDKINQDIDKLNLLNINTIDNKTTAEDQQKVQELLDSEKDELQKTLLDAIAAQREMDENLDIDLPENVDDVVQLEQFTKLQTQLDDLEKKSQLKNLDDASVIQQKILNITQKIQSLKNASDITQKQIQFQKEMQNMRFKGIHHFLNDVKYTSLKECPIDGLVKRQIEDLIVIPRREENEFMAQQKLNRVLFFGYSAEMIEETAKAIAVENKWFFYEIDTADLILKYIHRRDNSDYQQLKHLFQNAAEESADNRITYVMLVKNIDGLITDSAVEGQELIQNLRNWLIQDLDDFVSDKNQFNIGSVKRPSDIVVIFTSTKPTAMNESFLNKLSHKAIFFDFPKLKSLKVILAAEVQRIEGEYRDLAQIEEPSTMDRNYLDEQYYHEDIFNEPLGDGDGEDDEFMDDGGDDDYYMNMRLMKKSKKDKKKSKKSKKTKSIIQQQQPQIMSQPQQQQNIPSIIMLSPPQPQQNVQQQPLAQQVEEDPSDEEEETDEDSEDSEELELQKEMLNAYKKHKLQKRMQKMRLQERQIEMSKLNKDHGPPLRFQRVQQQLPAVRNNLVAGMGPTSNTISNQHINQNMPSHRASRHKHIHKKQIQHDSNAVNQIYQTDDRTDQFSENWIPEDNEDADQDEDDDAYEHDKQDDQLIEPTIDEELQSMNFKQVLNNQTQSFLQVNLKDQFDDEEFYDDDEFYDDIVEDEEFPDITDKRNNAAMEKCEFVIDDLWNNYKLENFHRIFHKNYEILVQQRTDFDHRFNNTLLGDDNVVMIRSLHTCLLFDEDLDSYLVDHALPIKSQNEDGQGHHFDKAGLIEEDVRNVLRVSIHSQINECSNRLYSPDDDAERRQRKQSHCLEFELNERTIKSGFTNYKPMTNINTANNLYSWANLHNYMASKLQDLSSVLSQAIFDKNAQIGNKVNDNIHDMDGVVQQFQSLKLDDQGLEGHENHFLTLIQSPQLNLNDKQKQMSQALLKSISQLPESTKAKYMQKLAGVLQSHSDVTEDSQQNQGPNNVEIHVNNIENHENNFSNEENNLQDNEFEFNSDQEQDNELYIQNKEEQAKLQKLESEYQDKIKQLNEELKQVENLKFELQDKYHHHHDHSDDSEESSTEQSESSDETQSEYEKEYDLGYDTDSESQSESETEDNQSHKHNSMRHSRKHQEIENNDNAITDPEFQIDEDVPLIPNQLLINKPQLDPELEELQELSQEVSSEHNKNTEFKKSQVGKLLSNNAEPEKQKDFNVIQGDILKIQAMQDVPKIKAQIENSYREQQYEDLEQSKPLKVDIAQNNPIDSIITNYYQNNNQDFQKSQQENLINSEISDLSLNSSQTTYQEPQKLQTQENPIQQLLGLVENRRRRRRQ